MQGSSPGQLNNVTEIGRVGGPRYSWATDKIWEAKIEEKNVRKKELIETPLDVYEASWVILVVIVVVLIVVVVVVAAVMW